MSINLNLDSPDIKQNYHSALAQKSLLIRLNEAAVGTRDMDVLKILVEFLQAADVAVSVATKEFLDSFERES